MRNGGIEESDSVKVKELISARSEPSPSFLIPQCISFMIYSVSPAHLQATSLGGSEQLTPARGEAGLPAHAEHSKRVCKAAMGHGFEGPALGMGKIRLG